MATVTVIDDLPYPPSVNHYWRHAKGRTYISAEGRRYKAAVASLCRERGIDRARGKLSLTVQVYPPDRRRRDIDNVLKALLDALGNGGAYEDDSQIKELYMRMREPVKGGRVDVTIGGVMRGTEAISERGDRCAI